MSVRALASVSSVITVGMVIGRGSSRPHRSIRRQGCAELASRACPGRTPRKDAGSCTRDSLFQRSDLLIEPGKVVLPRRMSGQSFANRSISLALTPLRSTRAHIPGATVHLGEFRIAHREIALTACVAAVARRVKGIRLGLFYFALLRRR